MIVRVVEYGRAERTGGGGVWGSGWKRESDGGGSVHE